MQKGKISDERRNVIKAGAKTMMITAAMTQFGGLMGTLEAATLSSEEKADLIYINGKVYTVDDKKAWAEAFAIKGGKFIAVGSNKEMEKFKGKETKVIDLKGQFVMPGLIDEHLHPDMGADNYLNVFIAATDTWKTITGKLKDFAEKNPDKKWIYGSSIDWLLDDNGIIANYGVPSNKSILDTVIKDRPVALWDQGAHAMLLNSKALEVLGIRDDSPNPKGGFFVKDKNGRLTGVIRETACTLVVNDLDNYSLEKWTQKGMVPFLQELSSYGVTAISDAYVIDRTAKSYFNMDKAGDLNQWVNLYMVTPLEYNDKKRHQAQIEFIDSSKKYQTEQIYPAGVKYILDGSAAGKTAVMLEPFFEAGDFRGDLRYPEDKLIASIKTYADKGYAIKAHAIGDRSIRLLLDVYKTLPKRTSGAMYSVAHGVFIDPTDVPRFKAQNVVYEASPAIWFPNTGVPIIKADIGPKRLAHAWPVSRLMADNAVVSYGSDWPVSMTPDPWPGLESIITRQVPGGSKDAFNPEFGVDLKTALRIFTLNGAKSMGIADKTGSIEAGKSADFIILNQNIFTVSKYEIHQTKVLSTVFRGSEVYTPADK